MMVSVVIPIYNVEDYIRKCIESVLNQTLTDIELICVDDCGTDESVRIVEEYAKTDNRVRLLFHKRNRGLSAARNTGLREATGKYVYFLDSDDYLYENALECLYQVAEERRVQIVYFDTDVMTLEHDENGCNGYEPPRYTDKDVAMKGTAFFHEAVMNKRWDTCVWRQFYRRDYLMNHMLSFDEGMAHEDWSFSFGAALLADDVYYLPERLHMYLRRKDSITDRVTWNRVVSLIQIYYRMHAMIPRIEMDDELEKAIEIHLANLRWYIQMNYRRLPCIDGNVKSYEDRLLKSIIPPYYGGYFYHKLSMDDAEAVQAYQRIAIYGAGEIGINLKRVLDDIGNSIETFLVTSQDGNLEVDGAPVTQISEYDNTFRKEGLVLIAVKKSYEIMYENARKLGYKNVRIIQAKKED